MARTIQTGDGRLVISMLPNVIKSILWDGAEIAFYGGQSRTRPRYVIMKQTPTRSPPPDLLTAIEAVGLKYELVDVDESEVP